MARREWRIRGQGPHLARRRPDGPDASGSLDVALALQAIAHSRSLCAPLRNLDGVYALALTDGDAPPDVHLDLRRRAAADGDVGLEEVTLRIAPAASSGFWAGEPGDAVRVLRGTLQLEGDARKVLRLLPALPRLRRLVHEELGRPAGGPVAAVAPLSGMVSLGHLPRVDTRTGAQRALVAALFVLARPAQERRAEIERLVLATTTAEVSHPAMVDVLEIVCSIARERTARVADA